ncbi:putative transcriptional regulator, Crp/Fnr family [Fibrisoma limi BUZ 3]|uniref:Putative transcriptional regulator, Crp/Fnr family n=1 Tax=Fibrisoma limi BUZ 3 TaxID=1185876 RepID=I2GH67_9BACT|nr:Crp/Fnr family transcriptional regulator [Fibrisoma limi]CCH53242.1 putative transcriptional regulator, Crp/Fnr family [Fibrisoma limi BUZ 3]
MHRDAAELNLLREAVYRLMPLPEPTWNEFASCWQPVSYKRKVVVTAAGEVERYVYFVLEGLQRIYHIGENTREATLLFSYTQTFSGIADSFQLQQPSRFYLETLTPSRLLRLAYDDFSSLLERHPSLERWGRLATAGALSGLLERYVDILTYSAEEKFRVLLTRSPHVLQLIPHKYLASYLGLDPTTFSKLLASVKL